jgi:hypothetical protein
MPKQMSKENMRDHLLACLRAKDAFRLSKDVQEKEANHERLFILLTTLPLDDLVELACENKGAA